MRLFARSTSALMASSESFARSRSRRLSRLSNCEFNAFSAASVNFALSANLALMSAICLSYDALISALRLSVLSVINFVSNASALAISSRSTFARSAAALAAASAPEDLPPLLPLLPPDDEVAAPPPEGNGNAVMPPPVPLDTPPSADRWAMGVLLMVLFHPSTKFCAMFAPALRMSPRPSVMVFPTLDTSNRNPSFALSSDRVKMPSRM